MVKLEVVEDNPWTIRAFALQLTRDPRPWEEILEEVRGKGIEKNKAYVLKIWKGYGHRIGGEFGGRAIVFDGISRINALYTWRLVNTHSQVYGSGLERSLRVIRPPFRCIDSKSDRLYRKALPHYEAAIERGIPTQDVRYILNEGILTTIIFNFPQGSERYFAKLANAYTWSLEEHEELKRGLEKIIREKIEFLPDEKPLSTWRMSGELQDWEALRAMHEKKNDYSLHFIRLTKDPFSVNLNLPVDGSLSMHAQLVRTRPGLVEIEPFEGIVKRAKYEIPPTFDEEMKEAYEEIAIEATKTQLECLKRGDARFVYYTLLGQKARAIYHENAASALHTARVRSCGNAQWEIRNKVGLELARMLKTGPRCVTERKCTEPKRKPPCPVQEIWPKLSGEEILKKLEVPLREFEAKLFE